MHDYLNQGDKIEGRSAKERKRLGDKINKHLTKIKISFRRRLIFAVEVAGHLTEIGARLSDVLEEILRIRQSPGRSRDLREISVTDKPREIRRKPFRELSVRSLARSRTQQVSSLTSLPSSRRPLVSPSLVFPHWLAARARRVSPEEEKPDLSYAGPLPRSCAPSLSLARASL